MDVADPIIELTRLVGRVVPEQRLTVESDVHGVSRCLIVGVVDQLSSASGPSV